MGAIGLVLCSDLMQVPEKFSRALWRGFSVASGSCSGCSVVENATS